MVKLVHLGAFLGVCFWWAMGSIAAGQNAFVPVLVRFHAQPNQVDAERKSLQGGRGDPAVSGRPGVCCSGSRGGYDFVNNDNDPWDDQCHGTHVAGTIAAGLNGFGAEGVAPGVDLDALKVLSSNGSGSYSAIISAIDWSINNNMQVLNLSLGRRWV